MFSVGSKKIEMYDFKPYQDSKDNDFSTNWKAISRFYYNSKVKDPNHYDKKLILSVSGNIFKTQYIDSNFSSGKAEVIIDALTNFFIRNQKKIASTQKMILDSVVNEIFSKSAIKYGCQVMCSLKKSPAEIAKKRYFDVSNA